MLAVTFFSKYSTFMSFIRETYGSLSCGYNEQGLSAHFFWPQNSEYVLPIRQFRHYIGRPAILSAGIVTVHQHPQMYGLPESVSHLNVALMGMDDKRIMTSFFGKDATDVMFRMVNSDEILLEHPITIKTKEALLMDKRERRFRQDQPDMQRISGVAVLNQLLSGELQNDQ